MIRYRVATNAGSTVKRCAGMANQIAVTPATLTMMCARKIGSPNAQKNTVNEAPKTIAAHSGRAIGWSRNSAMSKGVDKADHASMRQAHETAKGVALAEGVGSQKV